MELVNPWVEMGRVEGLLQGRVKVLLRQLRRRFGELPQDMPDQIARLADSQLADLAEALLDFQSLAEAQAWLARF